MNRHDIVIVGMYPISEVADPENKDEIGRKKLWRNNNKWK